MAKALTEPEEPAGFDYSAPESEDAVQAAMSLILELREDVSGPLARR